MKQVSTLLVLVGLVLGMSCASDSTDKGNQQANNKATTNSANQQKMASATPDFPKGQIDWVSIKDLAAKQKAEPRKVMVDLYTNWCGWCKRMDKDAFQHKAIADYVNEKFYAVKLDAETKETINFNGQNYEFVQSGRRGSNKLAHALILGDKPTGRIGYPTIAFLDENLKRIDAFPGYKDASKLDPLARFIAEDHYKSKTLAQFQQEYKSPITPMPPRNKRTQRPKTLQPQVKVQKQKPN